MSIIQLKWVEKLNGFISNFNVNPVSVWISLSLMGIFVGMSFLYKYNPMLFHAFTFIGVSVISGIMVMLSNYIHFRDNFGLMYFVQQFSNQRLNAVIYQILTECSIVDICDMIRNAKLGVIDFILSQTLPLTDDERNNILSTLPIYTKQFVTKKGIVYHYPKIFRDNILPKELRDKPTQYNNIGNIGILDHPSYKPISERFAPEIQNFTHKLLDNDSDHDTINSLIVTNNNNNNNNSILYNNNNINDNDTDISSKHEQDRIEMDHDSQYNKLRGLTREATRSTINRYTKTFADNIAVQFLPNYVQDWHLKVSLLICLIIISYNWYKSKKFRIKIMKSGKNWILFGIKFIVIISFIELQRRNNTIIYKSIKKIFRKAFKQ